MKKIIAFTACLVVPALGARAQGNLEPASGPAATMKTLGQIESRVAITNLPFDIYESGSYYLTGPLSLAAGSASGIRVYANHVTLDLNGFTLSGPGAGSGHGVYQSPAVRGVTVRNGAIAGWCGVPSYGIYAAGGGARIEHVQVHDNYNGIYAARGSRVSDCRIFSNTVAAGFYGIYVGEASLVSGCSVALNAGTVNAGGIYAGVGSVVSGCSVYNNSAPIRTEAIRVEAGSIVNGCASYLNSANGGAGSMMNAFQSGAGCVLAGCASSTDGSQGSNACFLAGSGSVLSGCSIRNDQANASIQGICADLGCVLSEWGVSALSGGGETRGIHAEGGTVLSRCAASGNGAMGELYGIYANAPCALSACVADSNQSFANPCTGLRAESGCVVLDCSALSNQGITNSAGLRGHHSVIADCLVRDNNHRGMYLGNGCLVVGNSVESNSAAYLSGWRDAGVYVAGAGNRLDGNVFTGNRYYSWYVEGNCNLIVRNSALDAHLGYYLEGLYEAVGPDCSSAWVEDNAWVNFNIP